MYGINVQTIAPSNRDGNYVGSINLVDGVSTYGDQYYRAQAMRLNPNSATGIVDFTVYSGNARIAFDLAPARTLEHPSSARLVINGALASEANLGSWISLAKNPSLEIAATRAAAEAATRAAASNSSSGGALLASMQNSLQNSLSAQREFMGMKSSVQVSMGDQAAFNSSSSGSASYKNPVNSDNSDMLHLNSDLVIEKFRQKKRNDEE